MTDGTWAEGVARFEAVHRERHPRGGYVSGVGLSDAELNAVWPPVPVAAPLTREQWQAIRDGLADRLTKAGYRDPMRIPDEVLRQSNRCLNCRRTIRIMINRGVGWCSEDCRKALAVGWEADAAEGATHALTVLESLRATVPDRYTERGWLAQPDDLRTADERHADE